MRSLLITECLQNDFVAPLPPGAPLPNALHIGRAESRRILGDPSGPWQSEGPLARFVAAWTAGAEGEHVSVHIRDWHDPQDRATRPHLDLFGEHCLRESEGARFVAPLEPLLARGAHVVDSAIVSDFVGTDLEATLRAFVEPELRVGIIGVWTDFKVQYLAYDLMTRLGVEQLAVCGALTASRSRIQHRQALDHMAGSLGVQVIDSLPEFLGWLGVEAVPVRYARRRAAVSVQWPEAVSLDDEERRIAEHLFRDCREVRLTPLSGGFSGSRVFGTASIDLSGRREVPFVVKMDAHAKIAKERVAVESVENLLGAASPRLAEYVDLESRGGIKYHFATMHGGDVRTLQKAFRAAPDPAAVTALFENVIDRVLSRLYQGPTVDRLALFDYYGYRRDYAEGTLGLIPRLASEQGDRLTIEGLGESLPHPRRFYDRLFAGSRDEPVEVACSWIHGDLNLANVLIDATGNTWLIDYFWTRVGHALQDIAKLENDLKFILVPLADDAALARAVAWERALQSQQDLTANPPALPARSGSDPAIAKAHAAIVALRRLGSALLSEAGVSGPTPPREYQIAQLRYSAHTLSFGECDLRQRRFALASSCLLAEQLVGLEGLEPSTVRL